MLSGINHNRMIQKCAQFLLLFCCTLCIIHNVPLSVDDLGFQNQHFASNGEALSFVLHYGNGRLLGNGGIVFFMHHLLLGDLIRAAVIAGVAILLPKVLRLENLVYPILTLFMLLSISPGIFGEAYSWMSGFQNYVPPVFLFLCALRMIQGENRTRTVTVIRYTLIVICGICMQLYIEHSSLLNCLAALIITFVCIRNQSNHRTGSVLLLVGSIIGFAIMCYLMLVIPEYVIGGKTSYLSGGLETLFRGASRNTVTLLGMYSENAILFGILTVLLLKILYDERSHFSRQIIAVMSVGLAVPTLLFAGTLISGMRPWYGKLALAESCALLVMFVWYIASAFITVWLLKKERPQLNIFGLLLLSAFFCILPTLFIWPVGYRCLFHSIVLLIGSVLKLVQAMENEWNTYSRRQIFIGIAVVLLASTVLCLTVVFSDIRRMASIREDYLQKAAETEPEAIAYFMIPSPYLHDYWDDQYEHVIFRNGRKIALSILPADVWFRLCYYHTS